MLRQMTMRRTRLFLILGLIALLPAVGALGQNQRVLVVRGGLLIDGTGADPVPNSVVVIANGKIQSVGREGSVTIPANATVIDAAGKTIIPGLVDSHVHLRNYHVQDYLYLLTSTLRVPARASRCWGQTKSSIRGWTCMCIFLG